MAAYFFRSSLCLTTMQRPVFHLNMMFDVVMIGKDLNPADNIVYMNMIYCGVYALTICINAGWHVQLNCNITSKVNRRKVAALPLGVSSLGHVSNPLCWALIPETVESEVT